MAVTKDQLIIEIAANTDKAVAGIEQLVTLANDFKVRTAELSAQYASMSEKINSSSQSAISAMNGEIGVIKVLGNEFDKVVANRMQAAEQLKAAQAMMSSYAELGSPDPEAEKSIAAAKQAGINAELQALALKDRTLKTFSATSEGLQIQELRRSGQLVEAVKLENQIELRAFDEQVKGLRAVGQLREQDIKLIDATRAAMVRQGDAKVSGAQKPDVVVALPKPKADFSGAFLKIGAVIGTATAAYYGFKKVLESTVGEYRKAQDGITSLSNSLKIMGEQNVEASVERFKRLSETLQNTTTVSDDHVIALASLGVAAGKSDVQIEKLIKASLDLAAATGRDVDTTFQALLNTYKGVARGISDIMPELQGLTAAQLRNGDAVDYVSKKMGGFAEAASGTYAGQIEQSKNIISDISETIGMSLSEGFNLSDGTASFIAGLKEIRDALAENGAAIAGIMASIKTVFANVFNFIMASVAKIAASFAGFFSMLAGVGEYVGIPDTISKALEKTQQDERKRAEEYWGEIKNVTDEGTKALERYIKSSEKSAKLADKPSRRPTLTPIVSADAKGQLQELIKMRDSLALQVKHSDDNEIQAIYTKAEAEKLQVDEIKCKLQAEAAFGPVAQKNYDAIVNMLKARANGEADKKRLDALNKELDITDQMASAAKAAGATQAQQIKTAKEFGVVQINLREQEARRHGLITDALMQQYSIQRDIAGKVYDDQIVQLAKQRTYMGGMISDAREFYGIMSAATGVLAKEAGDGLEKSLVAAIAAARNLLDMAKPDKEQAGPPKSEKADTSFIGSTVSKAAEQWGAFSGKIAAAQEQSLSANMSSMAGGLMSAGASMGTAVLGVAGMIAEAPAAILGAVDSLTGIVQGLMEFPAKLIEGLSNLDQMLTKALESLPDAVQKMLQKLPALLISIVSKIGDFIVMIAEQLPKIVEVLAESLPELISVILSKLPNIVAAISKGIAKASWALITGLFKGIVNLLKGVKMPKLVDTDKIGKDLGKEIKKLTGAASKLFDVSDMGKAAKNSIGGGSDIGKQIAEATSKAGMNLSKGWKSMMSALGDTWHDVLAAFGMATEAFKVGVGFFKEAAGIVGGVLSNTFKVVWELGRTLFQNAGAIFGAIWNAGKAVFATVTDAFAAVWQVGIDLFASLGSVFGAVWDAAKTVFDAITSVFSALWDVIGSIFQGWNATQEALIGLWDAMFKGVTAIFGAVWNVGQALFDHVGKIFESAWSVGQILFDTISSIFATVWEAGKSVVNLFSEGFKAIWSGFAAVFSMFWDGFQQIWSLGEQAFIKIKGILDPLTGALGDWFDKTVKFFKELDLGGLGMKLWEGIKKGLEGAGEIFSKLGGKIFDGLKSGLDGLGNVLSKLFKFDGGGKGTVENFIGMDFPFISFSKGGLVPGAASVSGDSMSNDTVPALLSPGEVVLPRSVLGDEAFRRMVMMKLAGQEIPRFAKGGVIGKVVSSGKKAGGDIADTTKKAGGDIADAGKAAITSITDALVPDWVRSLYDSVSRFAPNIDVTKLVSNPGKEISSALKSVVNSTLAPFIKQVLAAPKGFADGGMVGGTGSGDVIPAMLTPGEFVLKKSAVDNIGVPTLSALNGGASLSGGGSGATVVNVTLNIEARQNIDEAFIRQRVIPVIKDEFKRSSLDGRAIVYASGVRK